MAIAPRCSSSVLVPADVSVLGSQLGKLRSFRAGLAVDLVEWPSLNLAWFGCFHCGSRLFPARSGAVVVRAGGGSQTTVYGQARSPGR